MGNENNLTGTRATRNAGKFRVREKHIVNLSHPCPHSRFWMPQTSNRIQTHIVIRSP